MFPQQQLHDIAIVTATFSQTHHGYAASPIMPHINNSTEWSITQTPIFQSCESPSMGSHHSQNFVLDTVPPPPPIPRHTSSFERAPPKMQHKWSVQESNPALSPKNAVGKTHTFPAHSGYEENVYNIETQQYEKIENVFNHAHNMDSPSDEHTEFEQDTHDNDIATPQPSAFNMGNPPLVNHQFPQFPKNPNAQHQNQTFKTISDSESDITHDSDSSSSTDDSSESDSEDSDSDSVSAQINDGLALTKYGYEIVNKICTTIHGCVYEAKIVETKENSSDDMPAVKDINQPRKNSLNLGSQTSSMKNCFNFATLQHVAIKKVEKKKVEINSERDSNYENIMKEAIVLNYLSVLNKPPADNVCEYIDFIETDNDFYLIQEYGGSQTLAQFLRIAHQYIQQKKLKLKHWRITVKFIFWQLTVMLHWMHTDMNVCHLDLNTDNILIKNGDFFLNQKDGSITVDSKSISVKISDFGFAEIFTFDSEHAFKCAKKGFTKDHAMKAPQQYNGQTFDARKADCYSLGVILYEMCTGSKPYTIPSDKDEGYLALQTKKLSNYLATNGLSKHVYRATLSLVQGLIHISEEDRMGTKQILTHEWFKHYYERYKMRIEQKTKSQKERHQRQSKKIKALPYYRLDSMNRKHSVL